MPRGGLCHRCLGLCHICRLHYRVRVAVIHVLFFAGRDHCMVFRAIEHFCHVGSLRGLLVVDGPENRACYSNEGIRYWNAFTCFLEVAIVGWMLNRLKAALLE